MHLCFVVVILEVSTDHLKLIHRTQGPVGGPGSCSQNYWGPLEQEKLRILALTDENPCYKDILYIYIYIHREAASP